MADPSNAPLSAEGRRQSRAALFPAICLPPNCLLPLLSAFCLLIPQRHHRIHLHRPPSGDITGQQRHSEQKRRIAIFHLRSSILDLDLRLFTHSGARPSDQPSSPDAPESSKPAARPLSTSTG